MNYEVKLSLWSRIYLLFTGRVWVVVKGHTVILRFR